MGDSETSSTNNHHHIQRRPRSNTLEIYSNMNMLTSIGKGTNDNDDVTNINNRIRSDTVDFLIGTNADDPMGDIEMGVVPDFD